MEAENLYTEYERKASGLGGWKSYYEIDISPNDLFPDNSSDAQTACLAFITRHFEAGCKKEVMNFPFQPEYTESNRSIHAVSLFLTGFYLCPLFSKEISLEFERNIHGNKSWFDFRYIWFLTCLYHDTASCIEFNTAFQPEDLNLKHSPYKGIPPVSQSDLSRFYSSDKLAEDYFRYCKEKVKNDEDGACLSQEHGIVGGYLLFDRIYDNFTRNTKGHDWSMHDECYRKGLCWRHEHIELFRFIADAIISHNMWTTLSTDEDKANLYRAYNLDKLVIDPDGTCDQRLSFNDYPLQFMLRILDTIEPVKRFEALSPRSVLKNISIKSGTQKQINISWNGLIEKSPGFDKWKDGILRLKEWMQVGVYPQGGNNSGHSLTISIL